MASHIHHVYIAIVRHDENQWVQAVYNNKDGAENYLIGEGFTIHLDDNPIWTMHESKEGYGARIEVHPVHS